MRKISVDSTDLSGLTRRSFLKTTAAFATVGGSGDLSVAQTFPRPVRIVVPFVAGGASDTLARILGELLREPLAQTVLVENRPGGNSAIGMMAAATAAPDGHTMVAGHIGTHAITPAVTPPSGYDVVKTFTTLAIHASSSNLLVVPTESAVKTVQDLIALAKSKPGTLNYGSPGAGSPSHVATVQLARTAGIEVVHIPYRGNAAAITDLLGGRLQFMFGSPAEVLEHVRAGKLRAIGASGEKRSPTTPEVTPLAEQGVSNFNFRTWHVVSVRADIPPDVLAKLRKSFKEVLTSEAYRKRLADLSLEPGIEDGAEADKFVQSEIAYWAKFVKDANIQAG